MVTYLKLVIFETVDEFKRKTGNKSLAVFGKVKQNKTLAKPVSQGYLRGVMNGPLKFLTARKILPLLDLLAKFQRVLACSCSPNFCVARKLAKQIFYCCSCSQKNRSARHARECSQRPFVTPSSGRELPHPLRRFQGRASIHEHVLDGHVSFRPLTQ